MVISDDTTFLPVCTRLGPGLGKRRDREAVQVWFWGLHGLPPSSIFEAFYGPLELPFLSSEL